MDVYDFPFGWRGLTLNGHRTAAGALDTTKENDTARVNSFDPSRLQQRDQREALHLLSGGDLGDATVAFRYLSIAGTIKAPSGALLSDRISTLLAQFDIEEEQRASTSTGGIFPLTFTDTTTIVTGRGTPFTDIHGNNGEYVPEFYNARSAAGAIITGRRSGGDSAAFAIELVCPDRRRYIQTAEAVVLNAGNGFSATCPNWNSTEGISVSPILTILMAAAGATNLTISAGGTNLVLKMDAETAGTFTVDTATGLISKGATPRADLRTSTVLTPFLKVLPGGSVFAVTNTTGLTSVTVGYSQARG